MRNQHPLTKHCNWMLMFQMSGKVPSEKKNSRDSGARIEITVLVNAFFFLSCYHHTCIDGNRTEGLQSWYRWCRLHVETDFSASDTIIPCRLLIHFLCPQQVNILLHKGDRVIKKMPQLLCACACMWKSSNICSEISLEVYIFITMGVAWCRIHLMLPSAC